ncbi:MAG TPA: TonB family protein [Steroidobacteraceae bacterium]|nr:TonB family protein [Steroidobacteraceae bacterium]
MRAAAFTLTALLINLLLFLGLQALVGTREVRLADSRDFQLADFIRAAEAPPPVQSRRTPDPPPKPLKPPDPIDPVTAPRSQQGNLGPQIALAASPGLAIGTGGTGTVATNRIHLASELIPVVRASPEYPVSARARGTEGFVDLQFTVDRTGSVVDIIVIAASPEGVFEAPTLAAASRWKFQPKLVEGRPVAVRVRTRVWFRLDDSQAGG